MVIKYIIFSIENNKRKKKIKALVFPQKKKRDIADTYEYEPNCLLWTEKSHAHCKNTVVGQSPDAGTTSIAAAGRDLRWASALGAGQAGDQAFESVGM